MTTSANESNAARAFSWLGGVAFVVSLSYFLYTYLITFETPGASPVTAGPLAWNVMLFSVFALHHSVFARERVRVWIMRTFPRVERSVYVWIASALFAAVCFLWRPFQGTVWEFGDLGGGLMRALEIGGAWLSIRSAAMIDVWELAGIQRKRRGSSPNSQLPTPKSHTQRVGQAHQLEFTTRGPYGWVRHPIYLGWFLIVFSVPHMTMTHLVFALVSSAYVLVAIPFEERSLIRTSEGAYERYTQQVRWRLLPHVF